MIGPALTLLLSMLPLPGLSCSDSGGGEDFRVANIRTIKPYGKTVDWHHGTDRIVFGKRGLDRYYDVHVMTPDGRDERCITCDREACPRKHNGNPAWHPSGSHVVFTAEKADNPDLFREWAIPGTGFNCDLWLASAGGAAFHPLTAYPFKIPFTAVIHPHFSHDGRQLLWAERVERGESFKGGWALKLAEFAWGLQGPRLLNVRTFALGEKSCFHEGHSFSPDDERILFSGDLRADQPPAGMDIYELTPSDGRLKRLTDSPDEWDEHAYYSPDGEKIAWASSTGFDIDWGELPTHEFHGVLMTELWLMDADGSDKQRLTAFNRPGSSEFMDGMRTVVSDLSWGPDGKRIVALIGYDGGGRSLETKIVMIELEG